MKNHSPKCLVTPLCALLLSLSLGAHADLAKSSESELLALKKVCVRLAEEPRDPQGLKALLAYAKNTNGVPRLRSRAVAGYALSALFTGNTNFYISAQQSHARVYPEDKHLLRADLSTCYVSCRECQGRGFFEKPCPACEKALKCKACNGKGTRLQKKPGAKSVAVQCPVCEGTGRITCEKCRGSGLLITPCQKCNGQPVSFSATTKIYDDFTLIIKGMTKWINNEDVFYQQLQKAKSETDIDKRVAALKSLLAKYSYREECGEVEKLLAADRAVIQKQQDEKKMLAVRETREIAMLRGLKGSDKLEVSITTLNQYLQDNPQSQYRLELQAMANNMTEELRRKTIKRRSLYIFGGLFLLIFAMSCIRINHYNYNVFSRNREDDDGSAEKE